MKHQNDYLMYIYYNKNLCYYQDQTINKTIIRLFRQHRSVLNMLRYAFFFWRQLHIVAIHRF